jgi:orotidine-5'-phosphate decarboxylase
LHLSAQAKKAGLDGVVVSPHEIEAIKETFGKDFLVVVTGVRPKGVSVADQKRVLTPGEALKRGADYIVAGRPITEASDPRAAAMSFFEE